MKGLKTFKAASVFFLYFFMIVSPDFASSTDINRYFYHGNGNINMISKKNGASFKWKYRINDEIYDEKAIGKIHRVFGAEYGKPISTISLRLIEFLDFLEDHFRPGAQITILSGWRSPEYNTKLREKGRLAAKASLHQYGMAADIKMAGVPSKEIWDYIKALGFGGAGYYHGEAIHIDVGPARSWDETTSGVGTDISEDNKLIGLVTDFDVYRPGDLMSLRFIRMSAFPIGVVPKFALDAVEKDGSFKEIIALKPTFPVGAGRACPQFSNIGEMMGILYIVSKKTQPGRYRLRASFCESPWKDMPAEISTPEFEVLRP